MIQFDIIMPIAQGDVLPFKRNIAAILKNVGAERVVVIGPRKIRKEIEFIKRVEFVDEDSLFDGMTFLEIKRIIAKRHPKAVRRTGWYFQQFLKLAYCYKSRERFYMSWDSDTIPLKSIDFFDRMGIPYLDKRIAVKEDSIYFDTFRTLLPKCSLLDKNDCSFITEHMMFQTEIVKMMLKEIEENSSIEGNRFYEKILNAISIDALNLSGFSEFETYARFVRCRCPNKYIERKWKNLRHGRSYFGESPTNAQLDWVAEVFDVVSIEDFDKQLILCRILCANRMCRAVRFGIIYRWIEPYIQAKYRIRLWIRNIIRK